MKQNLQNKIIKKITFLILITALGLSCSSNISRGTELNKNEGLFILSFEFLNTVTIKGLSFDIIGNNETIEIDISKEDDNIFFKKLKKGYYKIENIKGTAYEGAGGARVSTHYISNKKLYFEVKPGKINHLGHIIIKEAFSRTNSNLVMHGKSNNSYLLIEIKFNQRVWETTRKNYPVVTKTYKMIRNYLSFSKPKIVTNLVFTRRSGIYRGYSGIEYRMKLSKVKRILKKEKRDFDVISTSQIVERTKENSFIKYIFSDNRNNYKWYKRLYKVIEITSEPKNTVITKIDKNYTKIGNNKWKNNFEFITMEKNSNGKIILTFIPKNYKR